MVIYRRFFDLAVWSVSMIHLTFERISLNSAALSFVALERLSEGGG